MIKNSKFTYNCYRASHETVEDVMQHMLTLQRELEHTDMHNLRAFNYTYFIITKNVHAKFGHDFFENEKTMRQIDVVFAQYYFDALKNYVEGVPLPSAWNITFDACKQNEHYQFIYMALGVNAHVNNDLAQSLHECANNSFNADYLLVNAIISDSLQEVAEALQENSYLLNASENILTPVYSFILNKLIQNWRAYAWRQSLIGLKGTINIVALEKKAAQLAEDLRKIKNIKQLPKIYSVWIT